MNADELMIGDWVRVPKLEYHDEITDDNGFCRIKQLRTADLDVDSFKELEYTEIEPIQLTAVILEKNGFKCISSQNVKLDNKVIGITPVKLIYKDEKQYMSVTRFDERWNVVHIYHDGSQPTNSAMVCNVHELQHALKLFGTDKEFEP